MKGWVTNFIGDYFETNDNVLYSPSVATEVPPMPSDEAKEEMKIQKEMAKILRKMAVDSLHPKP